MKYNPEYHNRQSNRLQGYDYAKAGAYFITICTYERECMFGKIADGKMILNDAGIIANEEWIKTFEIRKNMQLDVYVIMPNHIHGIIVITPNVDAVGAYCIRPLLHTPCELQPINVKNTRKDENTTSRGVCDTPLQSPSNNIGSTIRGYKSAVTKRINLLYHCKGMAVWQRNYHDHIIRNHESYLKISNYIMHNPENWKNDVFFKE